MLNTKKLKKL